MSEELRTYINPNAIEDGSIPISKLEGAGANFITDSDFGTHTHSVDYKTENVDLEHTFVGTTGETDAADSTVTITGSVITSSGKLPSLIVEYDDDKKSLAIQFDQGELVKYTTSETIVASSGHKHSYTPSGTIEKHTINMISEIVKKTSGPNTNDE